MVNKIKAKKDKPYWDFLFNSIWFLIKLPYILIRFFFKSLIRFLKKEKRKNNKKSQELNAKYEEFKIIKGHKKDYLIWEEKLAKKDSFIGIILGARGSGKSAIGIKILENMKVKSQKNFFAIGFKKQEMPYWINVVEDIRDIKNNSFVLIDEGGIIFSSRNSMSNANKILSNLLLISRHKNLSILFISQNSSNLDINVLRQADFLILKPSSLLQENFERKIIKDIYNQAKSEFKRYGNEKGLTYIYSNEFKGFVSNPLPSFWNMKLSKSFSENAFK